MNRRELLVASAALCLAGCSGRQARPKPRPKPDQVFHFAQSIPA